MKTFVAGASLLVLLITTARSGPSQTFDKSVTTADETPSWYAAREFNVQLWGTYLATANEYRQDRYLQADHAWGGGLDAKYFFNRYMAVGMEAYAVTRTASVSHIFVNPPVFTATKVTVDDTRTIGAGLATFTFRYPIGTSRFAPYVFAGGGVIAGGAQKLRHEFNPIAPPGTDPSHTSFVGDETKAIGQFGGGLEIRLTPRVGFINDFGWNVVDGRDNNFGMARTGINLAF